MLSKCLKKGKSVGERSGKYGGWSKSSEFSVSSLWRVIIETWGLALSWRRIGPFLLTNAGYLRVSFWCILSISVQYFSAVMVSPGFIKLWGNKPAEEHQTVTIIFFRWSFIFGKCCGALSVSSHYSHKKRNENSSILTHFLR